MTIREAFTLGQFVEATRRALSNPMTEPRARAILEGLKVAYPDLADLTSDLVAEADRGNAEARKAVEARIALNRAVERAWKTVPAGLPC